MAPRRARRKVYPERTMAVCTQGALTLYCDLRRVGCPSRGVTICDNGRECLFGPMSVAGKSQKTVISQTRFLVVDAAAKVGEGLRRFLLAENAPAVHVAP